MLGDKNVMTWFERLPRQFVFVLALTLVTPFATTLPAVASEEGPRISVREHVVFDGNQGWQHEGITYRLACGPIAVRAPNGDILVAWLSGSGGEPAADNCVLYSRSSDKGLTWCVPQILVRAGTMAGALPIMHSTGDGRLIALGAHWPSEKHYTQWYWFRMESRDSGQTWSEPESFVLHGNRGAVCLGPIKLANGTYLLPGMFFEERTRPLVAPVAALARAMSEQEALAMPETPGDKGGKFSTHLHGCCVFISARDDLTGLAEHGRVDNRPLGLLEPTCIQLNDGTLVMLMRGMGRVPVAIRKQGQWSHLVRRLADGYSQSDFTLAPGASARQANRPDSQQRGGQGGKSRCA